MVKIRNRPRGQKNHRAKIVKAESAKKVVENSKERNFKFCGILLDDLTNLKVVKNGKCAASE